MLGILARRHHGHLGAFRHPHRPDFGQQVDVQFIGKDQGFPGLEVLPRPADAGQALRPAGIVVFGDQLRAFPHPAEGMEPAAHRLGGDR